MPNINRVRVAWTNFPGAPGLSTFYLDAGTTDVTAIRTFFTSVLTYMPNGLTIQVPNSGDIVDSGTDKIVGTWTGTGGGTNSSAAVAGAYSGSSGAMVRWLTGAVVDGHRLVGRTYLVPLAGSRYANDGSLDGTAQAAILTAANAMIASLGTGLIVYHKPRNADDDADPPDLGSPGVTSAVVAALVPDLAVVLRSRRT